MPSTRAERLANTLRMPPLLAYILSYLISWRTLALVLAALNLKSLPFAWHIRLFILAVKHGRPLHRNLSFLRSNPASQTASPSKPTSNTDLIPTSSLHPLFRPITISSRTSLYETDYNLHKSNSTYFADLDHSRTALVASLLTPALVHSTLTAHGEKPGALYPILGAVHTSFLREIKPLERYFVRSRLLGWDRKWLIIASYFVRPATSAEKAKLRKERAKATATASANDDAKAPRKRENKQDEEEVLLACALNKYVIKKGRKTIEPGLALAGCGWFQAREGVTHNVVQNIDEPARTKPTTSLEESAIVVVPENPPDAGTGTDSPLPHPSQTSMRTAETVSNVVRRLSSAAADTSTSGLTSIEHGKSESEVEVEAQNDLEEGGYTWTAINAERLRGLAIAEKWMGLDIGLREEYEREREH